MKASEPFSLITIVSGRETHLANLLKGVKQSSRQPEEIVIVFIGEKYTLPVFKQLPVKVVLLAKEEGFSLSKARNLGAAEASSKNLVFLDVDCIPAENFFEEILSDLTHTGGLVMGTPKYLLSGLSLRLSDEWLREYSVYHPYREKRDKRYREKDYASFWSLCFAISKQNFVTVNGFDEQYAGYGAEDTDFAFQLHKQAIPYYSSPAEVFHQQHPVFQPPLNHLHSIITNAELFHRKWGKWPMENWLHEFESLGYIEWEHEGDTILIKKNPSEEEVLQYRQKDAPFA